MNTPPPSQRWRLVFAKTEAMRYTGNLDVQRTLERMFRRADLPLRHSRGYNPRPKMHIASALPLGVTGRAELMDFWLEQPLEREDLLGRLRAAQAPGLHVQDVELVDPAEPALQNRVQAAEYEARLLEPQPDLPRRVAARLNQAHLWRERRGKTYDLRPLILSLRVLPPTPGDAGPRLHMLLAARPAATGRPDEVLKVLGVDPALARVERVGIHLRPWPETPPASPSRAQNPG